MGLFTWAERKLRESISHTSADQQIQGPTFERLEPRVLLSGDSLGFNPTGLVSDAQDEQVILADRAPGRKKKFEDRRRKAETKRMASVGQ